MESFDTWSTKQYTDAWLTTDSFPPTWIAQLNKSPKRFFPESGCNEQINLLHTENRASMHRKNAQDFSTQFLRASFPTNSHKGKSNFSVLNEAANLKAQLNQMLYFSTKFKKTGCLRNNSCHAGKALTVTGF